MKPKSLSASSIATFEACPARWKAEQLDRIPSMSGDAAALGSVCHATLERWVKEGWYLKGLSQLDQWAALRTIYDEEFVKLSSDNSRQDEGYGLVKGWVDRQDWSGREVISTEVKKSFPIPTSQGDIPFNYIIDRMDRLDDGTIEVIDYKTNAWPLSPDDLRYKIQAQMYALAAQIEFPKAEIIWVHFDLLRFDRVGIAFTREENKTTWFYLKEVAERILANDDPQETLNSTCRFCVRKFACETLTKHAAGGGSLGISTPAEAADRRAQLAGAAAALKPMIEELDTFLLEHLEQEGKFGFSTNNNVVKVNSRKSRFVDSAVVGRKVSPAKIFRFAKLGVGQVDKLLKPDNPVLTPEEKALLAECIRTGYGSPTIQTSPVKG